MARTKLDLGGETIRLVVPMRPKGSSVWGPQPAAVRYFEELGEAPADAERFAAALTASYAAWRRAEDARPEPIGYDASLAPVARGEVATAKELARIATWHAERAAAVTASASHVWRPALDDGLAELAERFRTRDRAESRAAVARMAAAYRAERAAEVAAAEVAAVARTLASSGPTAYEVEHAPRSSVVDYSRPMPAGFVAVDPFGAIAEPAAPAVVPSALETCNACEVRPMVGPEHPGYAAGYCAECYADAITGTIEPDPAPFALPEPAAPADALAPETHPYRFDDTIRHPGASRLDCADCFTQDAPEPEPADALAPEVVQVRVGDVTVATTRHLDITDAPAPEPVALPARVLTVVQRRERPTCERCGQTFRLSGSGYAWHVANRPDCATRRLAVVA